MSLTPAARAKLFDLTLCELQPFRKNVNLDLELESNLLKVILSLLYNGNAFPEVLRCLSSGHHGYLYKYSCAGADIFQHGRF